MRYALLGLMAFSALLVCQSPGWAQRFSVAPASLQFGAPARPLPASLQSSYNAASGPACRNPDLWIGYDPCETCGSKCQECESCKPKKRYSGMLTSFHSAIGALKRKATSCCSEPACKEAPSCGCEQPASCGCEAPSCGCEAPSCGCEPACCGDTAKKCKWGLLVWLKNKINCKKKGCCDTACDSCTQTPACTSCQAAPAPKCAGGSCSSYEDDYPVQTPTPEPALQPVPNYQPSYQPHAHEPAPAVMPEATEEMELVPVEPAEAEGPDADAEPMPETTTPPNPFKDDPAVPAPAEDAAPAADPEAPAVPLDIPSLDASTGGKKVKAVGHQQLLNKFFLELRGGEQPSLAPTPAPASEEPRELTTQQQQAAPQETSKLHWQPRNKPASETQAPAVKRTLTKQPRLLPSKLIRFDQSR